MRQTADKLHRMVIPVLFFFLFWEMPISFAAVIKVPEQYAKIQQAVNAAATGDTVLVWPGVYFENVNFYGKKLTLASRYLTTGDISFISSTIIDGSQPLNADTASCVLMYNTQATMANDSGMALIGFTLKNGKGTRWEDEHAPGNFYREGGGILVQFAAPRIKFNIITGNVANDLNNCVSAGGAAIRCGDGNPVITNNVITYNNGRYGAGIVFNYSGGTVKNNIIAYNSGGEDFAGGGIWILGTHAQNYPRLVENNTIVFNSSVKRGGGFWLSGTSATTIRNNIVYGNSSPQNYQIYAASSTVTVTYNNVDGGYAGTGNININPALLTGSLMLHDTSGCIDAGQNDAQLNDPLDAQRPGMAKLPAKGTVRNDLGAYGGPGVALTAQTITGVADTERGYMPEMLTVKQNYPNPFNPGTVIGFAVKQQEKVRVDIYSSEGRLVKTIVNREYPAGEYEVYFNGSGLSSGVYYYRVTTSARSTIRKMLLMK